jgi:hypothetical protein
VRDTFFSPVLGSVTQPETVTSEMAATLEISKRDFGTGLFPFFSKATSVV